MKLENSSTFLVLLAARVLIPQAGQAFYNPSGGRWLARDPVQENGAANT